MQQSDRQVETALHTSGKSGHLTVDYIHRLPHVSGNQLLASLVIRHIADDGYAAGYGGLGCRLFLFQLQAQKVTPKRIFAEFNGSIGSSVPALEMW